MTLPELIDEGENQENVMPPETPTSADNVSQALKALLQQACAQGRLTCSLTSCVDLLSTRPDDVMLCVMPQLPHPDAAATIQSTLIRAVCQEHCIRVLSVDCDVKLAKVVCAEVDVECCGMDEAKKGPLVEVDNNSNSLQLKTPSACSEDTAGMLISDCDNMAPVMGFPCVLVQYPHDGTSKEDELVAEFCKEQLYGDMHMEPYIELPD